MSGLGQALKKFIEAPLYWKDGEPDNPFPGLGYLPLVSLFAAAGLLLVSIAFSYSQVSSDWGTFFFWLGLALIYAPIVVRFMARNVSRSEGIGLILVVGICSYLVSYMRSPLIFRSFDEFLHWRTAYDILQNQHLFTPNPLLPVSPLYAGLECVTTALVNLTGLSIVDASAFVLGSSRLVMLLGLYLLYERLSGSIYVAGMGVLVYMGSSTFLYFDAQYGYESLALPLGIMILFILFRRRNPANHHLVEWNLLALLTAFTLVLTHHATTYIFVALLLFWGCTDLYARFMGEKGNSPLGIGLWMLAVTAIWIVVKASLTIPYLDPVINDTLNSFFNLVFGTSGARNLFEDAAGQKSIMFDRFVGIASVLVLCLGIPFGVWQWWLRHKRQALPTAFALIAVAYPLLPLMRLSGGSWEVANRLSGFEFIGLSFIVALGMAAFPVPERLRTLRKWTVSIGLTIAFLGGVVAGVSQDSRLPQPYRAAANDRSIDSEGIMAANWTRTVLGPNHRMAGDRTMTNLIGSYGVQRMITNLNDKVSVSGVFLNYYLTDSDRRVLEDTQMQYLVVDTRITQVLSSLGYYFESWEQLIVSFASPVNASVLEKFDYFPEVSRVYDSGDIVIYDVRGLSDAP